MTFIQDFQLLGVSEEFVHLYAQAAVGAALLLLTGDTDRREFSRPIN